MKLLRYWVVRCTTSARESSAARAGKHRSRGQPAAGCDHIHRLPAVTTDHDRALAVDALLPTQCLLQAAGGARDEVAALVRLAEEGVNPGLRIARRGSHHQAAGAAGSDALAGELEHPLRHLVVLVEQHEVRVDARHLPWAVGAAQVDVARADALQPLAVRALAARRLRLSSSRYSTTNSTTRSDVPDVSRKRWPLDERPKMSHRCQRNTVSGRTMTMCRATQATVGIATSRAGGRRATGECGSAPRVGVGAPGSRVRGRHAVGVAGETQSGHTSGPAASTPPAATGASAPN